MGIEKRMGRTYYYRSRRVGGTVKREYGGSGICAVLAAMMDAEERKGRRAIDLARRARGRARVATLKAETAEIARWLACVDAVIASALKAFGWHQVNRQWRQRLETKMSNMSNALATSENTDGHSWRTEELWRQAGTLDQAALKKAKTGDKTAMKTVDKFLAHPSAQALYGDIGRHVLERWAALHAQGDAVVKQAVISYAAGLRTRLAGPTPNALDLLLVEKIVIAWLFSAWAEDQLARALTPKLAIKEHEVFVKRVELANRVLMSACRTLSKVRRSKLPDVLALVNVNPLSERNSVVPGRT